LDGELDMETREARHIGGCSRCGQTLQAYEQIGCGLQREMSAAVPEDLASRVGQHLRRRIAEETPPPRFRFLWPARIAAAAAVVILAGLAVRGLFEERQRIQVADRAEIEAPVQPVALTPTARPKAPTPAPTEVAAAEGRIAVADFTPASLGPMPPIRFVTDGGETKPAAISPAVRHVWLSNNPDACCAKFAEVAAAAGVPPEQITLSTDKTANRQVVVNASRRQLVDMVHAWAASGHSLLTPVQPQPEQTVFSGTGDEPVQYAAVFVPAGE
jgi:hypothetical protein